VAVRGAQTAAVVMGYTVPAKGGAANTVRIRMRIVGAESLLITGVARCFVVPEAADSLQKGDTRGPWKSAMSQN